MLPAQSQKRFTNSYKMAYSNIYFIGIGGIGMSAIARYYKFKGFSVGGYDRTPSDLTRQLEKEGGPLRRRHQLHPYQGGRYSRSVYSSRSGQLERTPVRQGERLPRNQAEPYAGRDHHRAEMPRRCRHTREDHDFYTHSTYTHRKR